MVWASWDQCALHTDSSLLLFTRNKIWRNNMQPASQTEGFKLETGSQCSASPEGLNGGRTMMRMWLCFVHRCRLWSLSALLLTCFFSLSQPSSTFTSSLAPCQQWQISSATCLKSERGWNGMSALKRRETKSRQECWWFNQGSPLSIRHCTGGASDTDGHERARENERR